MVNSIRLCCTERTLLDQTPTNMPPSFLLYLSCDLVLAHLEILISEIHFITEHDMKMLSDSILNIIFTHVSNRTDDSEYYFLI